MLGNVIIGKYIKHKLDRCWWWQQPFLPIISNFSWSPLEKESSRAKCAQGQGLQGDSRPPPQPLPLRPSTHVGATHSLSVSTALFGKHTIYLRDSFLFFSEEHKLTFFS